MGGNAADALLIPVIAHQPHLKLVTLGGNPGADGDGYLAIAKGHQRIVNIKQQSGDPVGLQSGDRQRQDCIANYNLGLKEPL